MKLGNTKLFSDLGIKISDNEPDPGFAYVAFTDAG